MTYFFKTFKPKFCLNAANNNMRNKFHNTYIYIEVNLSMILLKA